MKRLIFAVFVILVFTSVQFAQYKPSAPSAPDAAVLTKLLNDFLAGASRDDAAIHDKFWAADLIYTGSGGARHGKAEIMKGMSATAPSAKSAVAGAPKTTFTAEDIRIQQYGTTAIVAFRLVGTTVEDGVTSVANYYNTGTFLKRKGQWQAVGWQATRIPVTEEDAKKQVLAAESSYWQAVRAGDVKAAGRLLENSFIWEHHTGEQHNRKRVLDDMTSGALKYAKLETKDITVTVNGDTAIVRGTSDRQRAPEKDKDGVMKDQTPFTTFYTLVFVNRGGAWRIISLHTSRVV